MLCHELGLGEGTRWTQERDRALGLGRPPLSREELTEHRRELGMPPRGAECLILLFGDVHAVHASRLDDPCQHALGQGRGLGIARDAHEGDRRVT